MLGSYQRTMPQRSRKMNRRSKSQRTVGRGVTSPPTPPQFSASKRITGRARYLAASANAGLSITRAFLLNHLVLNSASGTTNYRILSGFRLRSIEMWQSSATSTTALSVEWTSSYGPSTVISDTPVGTAFAAHVSSSPPRDSQAAFWSLTGSNESEVVMILSFDQQAVIDITFEAIVQNGEAPVAVTTTASGTAGAVYMTYLSGVTTTTLPPVSYSRLT